MTAIITLEVAMSPVAVWSKTKVDMPIAASKKRAAWIRSLRRRG